MSSCARAFLIGLVAGMRSLTAPAIVSWGARSGRLRLEKTPLHFLGHPSAPYIASALAVAELIADKNPKAPSRKAPLGFTARIVTGALSGAAIGLAEDSAVEGLLAGVAGALAGTLGGYELRTRFTEANGGNDLPVALLEDTVAIGVGSLIVCGVV